MDLYGVNGNAISQGNSRRHEVTDLNDRIQAHNTDMAQQLTAIQGQAKTSDTIRDAQQAAQGLWTGAHMGDKIKSFNKWKSGGPAAKPNPIANDAAEQSAAVEDAVPDTTKAATTTQSAEEITTAGTTEVADAAKAGESAAADGLEEAASLGSKASSVLGGAAKVGGGILAAAQGGLDIYDDIKAGGIAGNNNWEKAGNVLQIGGSIADIAGTVFPPAALIGGLFDLASAATNEVGDKLDEAKKAAALKPAIAASQVATVAQAPTTTVASGRVE
tara:strand:+ start:7352 stop:8173 length:822 start_codon:yes stop_codon:yes gene_type:complete